MTFAGKRELKVISDKLQVMNHAVYLYRLLVRAGMEKRETLEKIMAEFTTMAMAPDTDGPPTVITTGVDVMQGPLTKN